MSILITSGFEQNWCEFAQTRLVNMGIVKSGKSKRNEFDAHTFLNKMCGSYKVSVERSRSFRQIDPGKAWQITAADLVVENSDIEDWGWADPRNLFFLEFWKEFDSACKFILIYGHIHQSIAHHIEKMGSFPKSPDAWVSRWNGYHSELLKFYHDNPGRCILVHVSEFSGNANGLSRLLNETLDVSARILNSEEFLPENSISILAANQILQSDTFEDNAHIGLYEELENAANLPDEKDINTSQVAENALKDYQESQQTNELLSQKLETQDKIADGLRDDLISANQTLMKRDTEIKGLQELIAQKDTLVEKLTQEHKQDLKKEANSKLEKQASKEQENELLLLQLHQVQEELEYYFSKFQKHNSPGEENKGNGKPDDEVQGISNTKQPKGQENFIVDFRSFVNGTGWHSPEDIGRWAGVSNESTVNLPSLDPGKYLLNVKIIDGMGNQMLKGLKLFLDGDKVNISRKLMSNLAGPLAPIRRLKAEFGHAEKPYPVEIKGVFTISEKMAQDKHHLLSFNVPNTISPAELGEQDTRDLSLCYQLLEIVKI